MDGKGTIIVSETVGDAIAKGAPSPSGTKVGLGLSTDEKLRNLLSLPVPVTVILAERDMNIESILATKVGTIIEFDVPFDSDLVLYVANETIARGQAAKIGENFGIRVTSIQSIKERVNALGHA